MIQALNSSEVIKIKQHRATNVIACHGVVDVDDFQDRKLGKNFHLKGICVWWVNRLQRFWIPTLYSKTDGVSFA